MDSANIRQIESGSNYIFLSRQSRIAGCNRSDDTFAIHAIRSQAGALFQLPSTAIILIQARSGSESDTRQAIYENNEV